MMVHLPGHAPGHCGLWVEQAEGPVLLAGDAVQDLHEIETSAEPDRAVRKRLYDPAAYRRTQDCIRVLLKEVPNLRLSLNPAAAQ